jgi:predicted CoA-substrate-specific enzyme activase
MITAGIDAGAENIKTLILNNDRILSYSIVSLGSEAILPVAQRALSEAALHAKISVEEIDNIVSTGVNNDYLTFCHENVTESNACAKGASFIIPEVDTVVDIGAEHCLAVKCLRGRPVRTAKNDRCAAGTGRFLKIASCPLGMDVNELGELSLQSKEDIEIENTCSVFAESEIISLVHQGYRPEDVAKAIFKGMANRIYTLIVKVGYEKNLVVVGGFAKNVGLVKALEEKSNCNILIPREPIIIGALGAALSAREKEMN